MSPTSPDADCDGYRFLTDRMLGTLTRYLRFMGYDTVSANSLPHGNNREDTLLLEMAGRDNRILLTRDRELARRGGERAIYIRSADVVEQVRMLVVLGCILPRIRMNRCSLCNCRLRPATPEEISQTTYAPRQDRNLEFYWCPRCEKLYWMGSHGRNLIQRLQGIFEP
ncbi:MAG: Mut7-C RNAse domain-containing protein [Methanomicrobiaceae archaeon]|nr:Mut7-C RNAse domain-containing protein [Methanomicrobiaceae archaeon]MDD5418912.1 Mut7-C RNAse domain-containing protein [Methanomicrobiaceae archaeon]